MTSLSILFMRRFLKNPVGCLVRDSSLDENVCQLRVIAPPNYGKEYTKTSRAV
jgi:hypothetical protein